MSGAPGAGQTAPARSFTVEAIQLAAPADATFSFVAPPIALTDGSFLVAWSVESLSSSTSMVLMERIDPVTMTTSEPTVLVEGDLRDWMLSVNSSGKGVLVWQTPSLVAYLQTLRVTP